MKIVVLWVPGALRADSCIVRMYVCIYVCVYVCMYVCIKIVVLCVPGALRADSCIVRMYVYICVYVCMYVCMYEDCSVVCAWSGSCIMRMYVCMCVYVRIHVCIYECMHIKWEVTVLYVPWMVLPMPITSERTYVIDTYVRTYAFTYKM